MTKVSEMIALSLMPISWLVSKSFATARIAMPTLVRLIIKDNANTKARTRNGVSSTTHFVGVPAMVTVSESNGRAGYDIGCPPVT